MKPCFLVVLTLAVISRRASGEDSDETTQFLQKMEGLSYFSNFLKLLKVAGEQMQGSAQVSHVPIHP